MGLIRLLLAVCVVIHHTPSSGLILMNGGIAVQAFYVISGYYMALVLCGKYQSLSLFYTNRLLRLYPAYWFLLAVAALLFFGAGANGYLNASKMNWLTDPFAQITLLLSNLTLLGQEWVVWFDIDPETGGYVTDLAAKYGDGRVPAWQYLLLPQAWTLSLELAFYAIAPFIVKRRIGLILGLALLSLGVRSMVNFVDVDYNLWVRRFFPSELCLFLVGVLAYRVGETWDGVKIGKNRAVGFGLLGGLTLLICFHHTLFGASSLGRGVIILLIGASLPVLMQAFGRSPIDRFLGNLSYPVYLCHLIVIAGMSRFAPGWTAVYWIVAVTLVFGAAIYLAIDRPIDRWRQSRAGVSPAPVW